MKRFETVMSGIRRQIDTGAFKAGDKLPSIRRHAFELGCSIATIQRAYDQLVSEAVCVSRPRSGYYVSNPDVPPPTAISSPRLGIEPQPTTERTERILIDWHRSHPEIFDAFVPSEDVFNTRRLNTLLRQAIRYRKSTSRDRGLTSSEPALATAIARRAAKSGIYVDPETIIVTRSATAALNICVSVFTRPGDVVLVETPAYFHSLATLRRRGLLVLEVESTSVAPLDPLIYENLLRQHPVKLCLLSAANRYPTGATLSSSAAQQVVVAARRHGSIIVENNVFGELSFDGSRRSFKQFDDGGIVLQYGSFTQLMSSDYGLGFLMADQFADEMLMVQYALGMQGQDRWMQMAIAEHLSTNQFERDLAALCKTLETRAKDGLASIRKALFPHFHIELPSGGYMGWLTGPEGLDTLSLYASGILSPRHFLPGPIFSLDERYRNCLGVNFSYKFDDAAHASLRNLAVI